MMHHRLIKHWMNSVSEGCLTIFQYHKIPTASPRYIYGEVEALEFSRVLANYLAWFEFLPLAEGVERLRRGALPKRAAAITFDDGYADWFEHIVPLLSAHRIPATFFITSSQLGKPEPFWHERIANAVATRAPGELPASIMWSGKRIGGADADIANAIVMVQEKLKYMALAEREHAIAQLEEGLPKNTSFRPFTAADIIRLRDAGFQIGGHSKNHPILAQCSWKEAQDEIAGCKEELEGILRDPVTQFAYPNGRPGSDFCIEHVKLVQRAGYRMAVTTASGVARSSTDIFQLPRFTPWARSDWRSALQIVRNMRVIPQVVNDE